MRTTIFLFLISVGIVYGGLVLPQKIKIRKSILIQTSSDRVSEQLYNLPQWEKWLTWKAAFSSEGKSKELYRKLGEVGAFVKKSNAKAQKIAIYIHSLNNYGENNSLSLNEKKLQYIAQFASPLSNYQSHLEGFFYITSTHDEISNLDFSLEINLGDNPFLRYLAHFYYQSKVEAEIEQSLERLKGICEKK